ncbi:MAG: PilC/PilY family type IV pilus protein [Syntrophaceae bacterium]
MKVKICAFLALIIFSCPFHALGQEVAEDETALFTSVAPDALLVLDLSGSMNWTPAGNKMYISSSHACGSTNVPYYADSSTDHDKACTIDSTSVPKYSDSTCSGPFYYSSSGTHTTNCSRLAIAKRAIFSILDDNQSGTINIQDESSLGVRFGYMRFYNCSSNESGDYSSGCNKVVRTIAAKYSLIFCGNSNSTTGCQVTSTGSSCVNAESASGGTPLAGAMQEAKSYLDYHKNRDSAASCRQKFAILVTDGSDTFACSGSGTEDQTDMYKRRRETVAKAKALADAGYRVFVVGFGGDMPHWLRYTLNWAAYYGGTDNPLVVNSGDITTFSPSSWTSCQTSATDHHNISGDGDHYYALSGDPGELPLNGYAFLATNPAELEGALRQAINIIREAIYSFSQVSVQSTRIQDENNLYEGSFQPVNSDPFWLGHLKKFAINTDGTVGAVVWDAGTYLQAKDGSTRNIKTCLNNTALVDFTATAINQYETDNSPLADGSAFTILGSSATAVEGFVRGLSTYNTENWKLGDVFRSTPITIGTPSAYYYDMLDGNGAFDLFRASHKRSSTLNADGTGNNRIILAGANDGQMHAFRTGSGDEAWSFVPPNLIAKLLLIAHSDHPTSLSHAYFVDGPVTVADVWWGSTYTSKSSSEWKTIMAFGEGRGAHDHLWSSRQDCTQSFSAIYESSSYRHFCGYYALNVTDSLSPSYLWRLNPSGSPSTDGPYLGDPWSKVMVGKIWDNTGGGRVERWVGFIGAGYNGADCSGGGDCDTKGKGFFIIDMQTGNVIWRYTYNNNTEMKYSIPANPSIVDADNDGFIDTIYVGDLGGNMWRFKLCLGSDPSCTRSNWEGGLLFSAASGVIRPIFTSAAVARDPYWNLWVYWGTGDKTDPTAANAQEKIYAVKDNNRTATNSLSDLENITSGTYSDSASKKGWYINFAGSGEKVLAEPTVFGGVVYLTTYTPATGSDPCSQAGTGTLYGLNYTTGEGIFGSNSSRSMSLGSGIPSAPIVSMRPGNVAAADLYVTESGGSGTGASTQRANFNPPGVANRTNMLYWRDKRIQ